MQPLPIMLGAAILLGAVGVFAVTESLRRPGLPDLGSVPWYAIVLWVFGSAVPGMALAGALAAEAARDGYPLVVLPAILTFVSVAAVLATRARIRPRRR